MGTESVRSVRAGELIFSEGEQGDHMYILLEGAVELKKNVEKGLTVLKTVDAPNDFFGEMALIDGRPRSATAVAIRPSRLLAVDGPTFESMILSNGKFALKIIKILSDRLRNSNARVEELTETGPRERAMRGMAEYARLRGERIHDGSYKVRVDDLSSWINGRLGVQLDEIEACIFRLLKGEAISYAPTSAKTKEHLLLPEAFVRENCRPD